MKLRSRFAFWWTVLSLFPVLHPQASQGFHSLVAAGWEPALEEADHGVKPFPHVDRANNKDNVNSSNTIVPGVAGTVYALAVDKKGALYVGGTFTIAGTTNANNIAKWDGQKWTPLGSGMGGSNACVYALCVGGNAVYAGGSFTTAGGVVVSNIAKWDGNQWLALGSGVDNTVRALAMIGTDVYAGGLFTNASGNAANYIAKWNGKQWSPLGWGVGGYYWGNAVYALAVSGTNLYVGGMFIRVDERFYTSSVARWDGSSWEGLSTGLDGEFPVVAALAVSGTNVYAGGEFTRPGLNNIHYIAKWDGGNWCPLASGMDNWVGALAIRQGDLYAGGMFTTADGSPANYVAKWNGTNWLALGSGANSVVNALAEFGSYIYAGGYFGTNYPNGYYVAKWDGNEWSPLIVMPPSIRTQPTNETVILGSTVKFDVTVDGTAPFFYQWRKNGFSIAKATNSSLTLNNVTTSSAGNYSVVVNNSAGSVQSANAFLAVYIVTNQLKVSVNGRGAITPNYSNAWLQINSRYNITAKAGNGFRFVNWTGDFGEVLTNSPTLSFVMGSNLALVATFIDIARPTLIVTKPTAGQRLSNQLFAASGKVTDNGFGGTVWYRLNWGDWTTARGWSNWTASLPLIPGTNNVSLFAEDESGNKSVTNSVRFQYVLTNQIEIMETGMGTISPNYSNAWLEVGRNYSVTATPGSGFKFMGWTIATNWVGSSTSTNKVLQFMMASNLTLRATFADTNKPTLTITAPAAGQKMTNAMATFVGTASDNWKISGIWYQLNGNGWRVVSTTSGYTKWSQTVTLLAGTNILQAYAQDVGGNFSTTNSVSVISSNTFMLMLSVGTSQPLSSNGLTFTLQLSSNLNGHIEYSTNLFNWQSWTNFKGANSVITFRDPDATNSTERFYRAVIP
jgi:hypothetical protein